VGVKGEGEHYKAVDCLLTLAEMLSGREEYDEALQLADEAARCLKMAFGETHPDTVGALHLVQKIHKRLNLSNGKTDSVVAAEKGDGAKQVLVSKGSKLWMEEEEKKVKVTVKEVNDKQALVMSRECSKWVIFSRLKDAHDVPCTGSAGPAREGMYWSFEDQKWLEIPPDPNGGWGYWDDESLEWCGVSGCFNGDSEVVLSDGIAKPVRDVKVGDKVAVMDRKGLPLGSSPVLGICLQLATPGKRVKIGKLLLSLQHKVVCNGEWVEPERHIDATVISDDCPLYNLVVENRPAIMVEGIIASTIGTYCEGAHYDAWPTHRLWGSEVIVKLYQQHPLWPNITLDTVQDNFLHVLKNPDFADEVMKVNPSEYSGLLAKYGWKQIHYSD